MRRYLAAAAALLLVGMLVPVHADEDEGKHWYDKELKFESKDKKFSVKLGSRLQLRLTVDDPEVGDTTRSFRVRRAKLSLDGKLYGKWLYKVQAAWSGSSTTLEDAYIRYIRAEEAQLWLGQGKTFFSRQQLTSSGKQQFVDRAITDARFDPGRDQGIALVGNVADDQFEYNVGVYNGSGANASQNDDGSFLYTGRAVWTPFGAYKLEESALDYPEGPGKLAFGLKALSTTDPMGPADVLRYGAEFAYKIVGFNVVTEYFSETREMTGFPDVDTDGMYLQVGYLFPGKKAELALRAAMIESDDNPLSITDNRNEYGLAINYYFVGHKYKLQGDVLRLENDADPSLDTDQGRLQLQIAF